MPRPPMIIPEGVLTEIKARTARGEGAETIRNALAGMPGLPSVTKIYQLQREWRATKPATPPPPAPADEPEEVIPPGTTLEQIDAELARLDRAANQAEVDGNYLAVSSIAGKRTALLVARAKFDKASAVDASPDMHRAAETFMTWVDGLCDRIDDEIKKAR